MIAEFNFSHEALIDQLGRVSSVIHEYPKVKIQLPQLENYLLKHVSLQDKNFYNGLRTIHEGDRQSSKMIDFLEQDLRELKIKIFTFLEDHPGNMADIKPGLFIQDFNELSRDVMARLTIERNYLFSLVDKESV